MLPRYAGRRRRSAISPLYLPYISPISPLYLAAACSGAFGKVVLSDPNPNEGGGAAALRRGGARAQRGAAARAGSPISPLYLPYISPSGSGRLGL